MIKKYVYLDANKKPIFRVVRTAEKRFYQQHLKNRHWVSGMNEVTPIPYNLPAVLRAISKGETVYIVEGEKDCHTLMEKGLTATTNPMGAGKWIESYSEYFDGAIVIIIPDNDFQGWKHAFEVAESVYRVAASVKVVGCCKENKGDVTDFLQQGNSIDDLLELIEKKSFWHPSPGAVEPEHRADKGRSTHRVEPTRDDCPALPQEVESLLIKSNSHRPFIDDYIDHAVAVSPMTPEIFHESGAVILLSILVARRLKLEAFSTIFPNLFVLWLADSTIYHKTTGLNVLLGFAKTHFSHLLLPQDMTPEAIIHSMAGNRPSNYKHLSDKQRARCDRAMDHASSRSLFRDEMSGFFATAKKDYGQGLEELILTAHDGGDYSREIIRRGLHEISNIYLSIIGGSTPAAMHRFMQDQLRWENGFWPRWALLTPESGPPPWQTPSESPTVDDVNRQLKRLSDKLPESKGDDKRAFIECGLETEAAKILEAYSKALISDLLLSDEVDTELFPSYGRFPVMAYKVSILMAGADWPDDGPPTITAQHATWAIRIVERWRRSLHRSRSKVSKIDSRELKQRVLNQIAGKASGGGATVREIGQNLGKLGKGVVYQVCNQLLSDGEIKIAEATGKPRPGRPTTRYLPA